MKQFRLLTSGDFRDGTMPGIQSFKSSPLAVASSSFKTNGNPLVDNFNKLVGCVVVTAFLDVVVTAAASTISNRTDLLCLLSTR